MAILRWSARSGVRSTAGVRASYTTSLSRISPGSQIGNVLRLHVFGTAHVRRDERPLDGAAAQRRVLALLAIVAAHGTAGVSRDKLLALLWPEGDPDRSRHALTQSLYNLRRALECDDVVLVGSDVRLNPDRMTSDIGDFIAAAERRSWRDVVEAHRAPFLDGFFVAQAPEFERWVSEQRSWYSLQAARALAELAEEAERAGEVREAVEWRRRHVALDPLDSGAAYRLMQALAAAGEHAQALQLARSHQQLLHDELGTPVSGEIAALAEQLRRRVSSLPEMVRVDEPPEDAVVRGGDGDPGVTGEGRRGSIAEEELAVVGDPDDQTPVVDRGWGRVSAYSAVKLPRWWRTGAAIIAAATLAVLAWVAVGREGEQPPAGRRDASRLARQAVVVGPFRVGAADPSLAFLREGMVDLLASRLDDDSASRVVDPSAALAAWRATGLEEGGEVSGDVARRLGERLGARILVTGSVVGTASRVFVSASAISLSDGAILFTERVDRPADSLTALVDDLATRLVASNAGLRERLVGQRLPPLAAVRAFLNGQALYRREAYADAVREYERALELDSTFALAALRLALAADRLNTAEQHDGALGLAWSHKDALSPIDRAHLVAFAGPRYPDPSNEAEQLRAWNEAAMLAPDRSEVWEELGERFFYSGAVLGAVDARARAQGAFERALALDPSSDGARIHLLMLAARSADTATLRRYASEEALRELGERSDFVRWRVSVALGHRTQAERARERFPAMGRENLRLVAQSTLYDGIEAEDGERALRLLRARSRRTVEVVDAILAQHALALNEGRATYALDLTEQLEQLSPASEAHLRLRVLDAMYGEGDSTVAREAARELVAATRDSASARTPDVEARYLANLCVLGQWRVSTGDFRELPQTLAALRGRASVRRTIPVSTPPRACAELLEAMAAVQRRSEGALVRVQRLDSLMLTGPAVGDAGAYAPLAVSRMYRRLGDSRRALHAIRRRAYFSGWPRYLASVRREEALLAMRVGEVAAARELVGRYLTLRRPEGASSRRLDDSVRNVVLSGSR